MHVATPYSREDPLSECSRPRDNAQRITKACNALHHRVPLLHRLQLYDDALWCGQQVSILCVARIKFRHNLEAIPFCRWQWQLQRCGSLSLLSTGGFRDAQLHGQNPHCLQSDDTETVDLDFVLLIGVVCMMRAFGIGGRVGPSYSGGGGTSTLKSTDAQSDVQFRPTM